ncbi:hypothetical protein SLS58_005488 [Diplodia intermedia]|uniref:FAD dependent oxidoreductase domain-containing protein n=1 Tax=Diplodia intermedia TaxID=856260 RepID=A0ABR3TRC5_9PEZI
MPAVRKDEPIIVIGAGAFGLSTVLHLSRAGYTNISVYEQDTQVPPRQSAANDINKIVRAEYEDPFYTELSIKAIDAWKHPLFAPHFHATGFLHCISGAAPTKARATLARFRAAAEANTRVAPHVEPIDGAADIRRRVWQYEAGPLPGWRGYLNRFDGYANSGAALRGVYEALIATPSSGVRFFLGARVVEIVYDINNAPPGTSSSSSSSSRKAVGVRTADGTIHPGTRVVVACGAGAARLVPAAGRDLGVAARAWSVAHVALGAGEAAALRGLPVTYARDLGFLFEPDAATRLLKLCPMGGGVVNTDAETGVSLPPTPTGEDRGVGGFMPEADEGKVRELLRQTLPALAERPLVRKGLCWFADKSDSDFVIDFVPGTEGSVVLLSGDSGHGFKMFPIFGEWVKTLFADGKQEEKRWRWKGGKDGAKAGNWGGDVSWRIGDTAEFEDIRPAAGKVKL